MPDFGNGQQYVTQAKKLYGSALADGAALDAALASLTGLVANITNDGSTLAIDAAVTVSGTIGGDVGQWGIDNTGYFSSSAGLNIATLYIESDGLLRAGNGMTAGSGSFQVDAGGNVVLANGATITGDGSFLTGVMVRDGDGNFTPGGSPIMIYSAVDYNQNNLISAAQGDGSMLLGGNEGVAIHSDGTVISGSVMIGGTMNPYDAGYFGITSTGDANVLELTFPGGGYISVDGDKNFHMNQGGLFIDGPLTFQDATTQSSAGISNPMATDLNLNSYRAYFWGSDVDGSGVGPGSRFGVSDPSFGSSLFNSWGYQLNFTTDGILSYQNDAGDNLSMSLDLGGDGGSFGEILRVNSITFSDSTSMSTAASGLDPTTVMLLDGSQPMTSTMDLGAFDISNVSQVHGQNGNYFDIAQGGRIDVWIDNAQGVALGTGIGNADGIGFTDSTVQTTAYDSSLVMLRDGSQAMTGDMTMGGYSFHGVGGVNFPDGSQIFEVSSGILDIYGATLNVGGITFSDSTTQTTAAQDYGSGGNIGGVSFTSYGFVTTPGSGGFYSDFYGNGGSGTMNLDTPVIKMYSPGNTFDANSGLFTDLASITFSDSTIQVTAYDTGNVMATSFAFGLLESELGSVDWSNVGLTSFQTAHLVGGGSAPTIAAGVGAGTSPTISVNGTDLSFTINLTPGTLPATGVIATVTFNSAYASAPRPAGPPAAGNAATAALSGASAPYWTTTSTTAVLNSGTVALTAAAPLIISGLFSQ